MNNKILFQIKKFKKNKNFSYNQALFSDLNRISSLEKTIDFLPKNSIIIFREYNLEQQKKQALALKIRKLCKKLGHKFIVAKDFQLAKRLKADGVHFSDLDKNSWQQINKITPNFIKTLACHSQKSIIKAQKSKADILFLSPIFKTKSHKNSQNLGILALKKAKNSSKKPIFALGGINQNNIKSILKSGASGFGGIEVFIP